MAFNQFQNENLEIKLEFVLKIVEMYDNYEGSKGKKRTRSSACDDKVFKRNKTMIPVVGTEHTVTGAFTADDRWSTSKLNYQGVEVQLDLKLIVDFTKDLGKKDGVIGASRSTYPCVVPGLESVGNLVAKMYISF